MSETNWQMAAQRDKSPGVAIAPGVPDSRTLPVTGATVLDLSPVYNGPCAAFLMAMAGPCVVKIEPSGGEHLRRRGDAGSAAMAFAMLNSNKQSLTRNLKAAEAVHCGAMIDLAHKRSAEWQLPRATFRVAQ